MVSGNCEELRNCGELRTESRSFTNSVWHEATSRPVAVEYTGASMETAAREGVMDARAGRTYAADEPVVSAAIIFSGRRKLGRIGEGAARDLPTWTAANEV